MINPRWPAWLAKTKDGVFICFRDMTQVSFNPDQGFIIGVPGPDDGFGEDTMDVFRVEGHDVEAPCLTTIQWYYTQIYVQGVYPDAPEEFGWDS